MDWESEVIKYLESMTRWPFFHDVPSKPPKAFGTVERDGGAKTYPTGGNPLFTIQNYGETRAEAARMAETVSDALLEMPYKHPNVFCVEIESNYRDDDPDTGQPRYRVTAILSVC